MKNLFEAWERLRRRHFLQVWGLIYSQRDLNGPDSWMLEQVNGFIKKLADRWSENGYLKP